nr:hypothetical protein [Tanacetum cinerariifolium]GEX18540.1 hypothetical protein [Tanacetum cinerariifolium]
MDKEASVPIVTIKAKIDVVDEIRKALTPYQWSIFEKTCFGHWLDVRLKKNSQLLIHTLLTRMVDGKANELSFLVLVDVEDNDAVKICLLILLEQGFLGHQLSHNISDDKLNLEMVYINARCGMMPNARKGKKIQYTMTRFVWAFMIWILEAIPATHRYVHKQPTEKIPRALAWESTQPFTWSRCCTLFVRDQLALPLETRTPTKGESETDWWKASLKYFEGKHVERKAISQLEFEKDGISKKKRKRGSSKSSLLDPTYEQLMTTGDKRVSTLTQTVSSLQATITTLESQMLALEGDEPLVPFTANRIFELVMSDVLFLGQTMAFCLFGIQYCLGMVTHEILRSLSDSGVLIFQSILHPAARSRGSLNRECAILLAGRSREAIPDEATANTFLPSDRNALMNTFQRKVFPVPS